MNFKPKTKVVDFETSKGNFAFVKLSDLAYDVCLETISSSKQINYTTGDFNTLDSRHSLQLSKNVEIIVGKVTSLSRKQYRECFDLPKESKLLYKSLKLFMESLNVFTSFPQHLLKTPKELNLGEDYHKKYAELAENVGNWYLIKYKQ